MNYVYLGIILGIMIIIGALYIVLNERKQKKLGIEKERISSRSFLERMVKTAITAALAYLLYFLKFPLPFFPSFLEINFSMFPIILLGFMFGPSWGAVVVLIRFLLKIPFTHTAYVGEFADLLIGLMVVVSSSLVYKYNKTKKGGIIALIVGFVAWVLAGVITNYFINIPFYVKAYFGGDINGLINMLKPLYKNINESNFMYYYLVWAIIPFNALLAFVCLTLTFFIYKTVSKVFKKDFFKRNKRKILIACDSFKGSMTSLEVGETVSEVLNDKGYEATYLAVSDGGEGFLDSIEGSFTTLKRIKTSAYDAFMREKEATYLVDTTNKKAYFELAEVCGIAELTKEELNPFAASTYGLGMVIKHALENYDIKEIYIGIGGSASNDGASGMMEALGVKFYDENHQLIKGLNNDKLPLINSIDDEELKKLTNNIKFTLLTDVTNPLLGPSGATYVYSPQKGAKEEDLEILEKNMEHYSEVINNHYKTNYTNRAGSGAAGGCGFGIMTMLHAESYSGIDYILDMVGFNSVNKEYDEVITGEGKFDEQSLNGKVISGIMKKNPKKLTIICGISNYQGNDLNIYSIVPNIKPLEYSLAHPKESLVELIKKHY